MPVEVKDAAGGKRHKCLRAKAHPAGKPFGYCLQCSFVVVRFLDMWWHLDGLGPGPSLPRKNKEVRDGR